jgi:deoxyribodipyrimidine photolyase-related protein
MQPSCQLRHPTEVSLRHLVLVLGDQLDAASSAFDGFASQSDAVCMMEVDEEATYIAQHKIRLVLFFSAMRHFRDELLVRGIPVHYREMDDPENGGSFANELEARVRELQPQKLIVLEPGDDRVRECLLAKARELEVELEIREDRHFYCSLGEFNGYSEGRHLILENFYRTLRKKHGILMDGGQPVGDRWNFDAENRKPLTAAARKLIAPPRAFFPDAVTRGVIETVERRFADSPGCLKHFDYPVSRADALQALEDFIAHRLGPFGPYEDAMTAADVYLFHSRLSSSLNLHLLRPQEVVEAAVRAYESGAAPLNSVEGFVRQILGWREFVRGIYWRHMPAYRDKNALDATLPVPRFFWTAETDMNCIRHTVSGLIDHAYAHHIHRLMVLGLFGLLLGVHPYRFHEWHMSMFVDAIDWVSLPNTLGMSQYADGGIMATKPYSASGNYIHRMSDYCKGCRYKPSQATGDAACPFTTLYWDFLARNREALQSNHRMLFQIQNLNRHDAADLRRIRKQADAIRGGV